MQQQHEEETRTRTFNPNEHLIQLNSKNGPQNYLPVQWRLVWFRNECPEGTIETEIVHLDLDKETEEEVFVWNAEKRRSEKVLKTGRGVAIVRATVRDGRGGVATGTKMEKAASFPDWLEKAETGSIGRALAGLGFGTQFAPELNEEHRIVDAPVDFNQSASSASGSNGSVPSAPGVVRTVAKKQTSAPQQAGTPPIPASTVAPSVKELKKMCLEILGPGKWDSVLSNLFGEMPPDDNITPEQQLRIKRALDVVVARRKNQAQQEPGQQAAS